VLARNIPNDATEEAVRSFFKPFGAFKEMVLTPVPKEGSRRARSVEMTFATPAVAATAFRELHGKTFPGHSDELVPMLAVRDDTRVYVGNVPHKATEADISKYFSSCGAVASVSRLRRGFVVEFASGAAASKSLTLSKTALPDFPPRDIRVEIRRMVLQEDGTPAERARERKPKVFVSGLPEGVAPEAVTAHFGGARAGVLGTRLVAGGTMALVDFDSAENAELALKLDASTIPHEGVPVAIAVAARAPRRLPKTKEASEKKAPARGRGKAREESKEDDKAASGKRRGGRAKKDSVPEEADPCAIFVVGFRDLEAVKGACSAFGEVSSVRLLRSRPPRAGQPITVRCIVKMASAKAASDAAGALEGVIASAPVQGDEAAPEVEVTVHAHLDDPARRRKAAPASASE